jgi:hypothetical protein
LEWQFAFACGEPCPRLVQQKATPREYHTALWVASKYGMGDSRQDWHLATIIAELRAQRTEKTVRVTDCNLYHRPDEDAEQTDDEIFATLRGIIGR